ncbi:MAG: hypothetical protein WEA80_13090 [Gemmatimonadaceae bacterium]
MATTEHTLNDALAAVLRTTRRAWANSEVVRSENSGMLIGSTARPDILVLEANVSPVVIETEVFPATTVESEAMARLGKDVTSTGRTILSSIAVRLNKNLRKKQGIGLSKALVAARDIEFALYTGTSAAGCVRWPANGWLRGSVGDLSTLTQSASVPPEVVERAADQLVWGVSAAAGILAEIASSHPSAVHKISTELRQEDGEQTRRMAMTILANAFVFQETLAGGPGKLSSINSLDELRSRRGGLTKRTVLAEWQKILKVNYWPIFDIARRILEDIPAVESIPLIDRLVTTADNLLKNRLMRSHDLTGAVFQRLIADRKFLAAFYTRPASAALLVDLAITADQPPGKESWANVPDVTALRVADFACGTGTLLSTVYQRMGQLHELGGGDAEQIHPAMMANALIGCDVLPAAAHLTASMLAGAHPTVTYEQSCIMTVAYGKQPDGRVALGSLDLLDEQGNLDILAVTAKHVEGMGESEKDVWLSLPHASFDVVIMNPPFTRATGHEGEKVGVPNPMFAAFSSTKEEQRLMGEATKRLTEGTSAHGNAGEASIFLVLADRKLKQNGALGLVMPLSLMSGDAWEDSRNLLKRNYADLVLVSIAGGQSEEMSFSADTHMGECLVAARKSKAGSARATFVVLAARPESAFVGAATAKQIRGLVNAKNPRRLEDGPIGGTSLYFGDDEIGQALNAPLPVAGGWNLARIADLSLAQTAYQLTHKHRVWLPSMMEADALEIPVSTVGVIAEIGPYHMDINATTSTGGIRGPFKVSKVKPGAAPTYPVLWAHDATAERKMAFDGDSEGRPLPGKTKADRELVDEKVAAVWATASHCHFNRDFRFNSQSTAMQFTMRKTIGGRAWPSLLLASTDQEKALVLWGNTSLGLLLHWWHANKQQSGRGSIGVSALETLPTLNVKALDPKCLTRAASLFDALSAEDLLPLHEIDRDPARRQLDDRFALDVLGLSGEVVASGGPLELLRLKLSREPSIRGGK